MLLAVIYADQQLIVVYQRVAMQRHSQHSIFDLHGEGQRFLSGPDHGHFTMLSTQCSTGFKEFQQLVLVIDQAKHVYFFLDFVQNKHSRGT